DWDRPRLPLDGNGRRGRACHDDVGLRADQLLRERSHPIGVIAGPTKVHPHTLRRSVQPKVRKRLRERGNVSLPQGIVFVAPHEHADAPHGVALLRGAGAKRPRRRSAAESGDEFTPSKANPHLPLPCEARAREPYRWRIARPKPAVLSTSGGGG